MHSGMERTLHAAFSFSRPGIPGAAANPALARDLTHLVDWYYQARRKCAMFMQELLYFVTTAEHLSFTSAANQLFITQSGLSKHIFKMEQELGVQLFERDRRSVKLTPAGESFLSSARTFLMECNFLKMMGEGARGQIQGRISVGISCHYGHYGHLYVSRFLQLFQDELEHLELSVSSLSIPDLQRDFAEQKLDFAIGTGSVVLGDPAYDSRPLMPRCRQVILSHRHPLASLPKIKVSQLKDEVFAAISREDTPAAFDMVIALCNCVGFYPKIGKRTDNFDTLYMLVEASQMVAISCVEPDLSTCSRVRAIPIDEEEIPEGSYLNALVSDLYVAWRRDTKNPLVPLIVSRLDQKK